MKDDTLDLEEFKKIFSDLPEYDKDDIEQDSSYDEAQQIVDWFNQGLEDSDEEIDNEKTEEVEHNWQQRIWEIVNNGAIEFGDLVNCIPRDADFDEVNSTLCGLQEMDVEVILSDSHKKEKACLKEELKELSQDSNNKAVRTLLNEISHYPFLKKREEGILIFLAQHGNVEARNRIVQSYMQYVVNMARNYIDAGLPFIDLVQEGCLGLIEAIDRYDASQSNRLYHYAYWWIKQRINRAISKKSRLIRLPVVFEEQMETVKQARQQIENRLEREATRSEIAEALDIDQDKVEEIILWMNSSFVSLSETYEEDERYDEIIDNPLSELIPEITISENLIYQNSAKLFQRLMW
ncbi:MAG: sigma-70 family RNA polymerase sigma factor [Candidatus Heimdallarchaeaceae archaeon]